MKLTEHFSVQELVHPDIIKKLGVERAANLVSPYLLRGIEKLRAKYGPIHVNGGNFTNSGMRKASFYKNKLGFIKESYSTHLYGTTADLKFSDTTAIEVYDTILANPDDFPYVIRMENAHITKTWLHIEFGKVRRNGKLEVFNP